MFVSVAVRFLAHEPRRRCRRSGFGACLRARGAGSMSLLADLLPPFVSAAETREDRLDVELFPEEELALGDAVEKRRREFMTGRACAREALAGLGFPDSPVGSGTKGEPLWPPGVVGSITHCEGYRACASCSLELDADDGDRRRAERPASKGSLGGGGPRARA